MNTNNYVYCQLKYALSLKFSENILLAKPREKCFIKNFNKEFYIEEYYNFKTLKQRLDDIYNNVVQGYKNREINILSDECSFPEFMIFNRYEEYYPVGISAYGWKISIFIFDYLNKYFKNVYGKDSFSEFKEIIDKNQVFFYWDYQSEPNVIPAYDLVSEEIAHIILKEFLDTGRTERELEPDIFYQEILRRNY